MARDLGIARKGINAGRTGSRAIFISGCRHSFLLFEPPAKLRRRSIKFPALGWRSRVKLGIRRVREARKASVALA